MANCLRLKVIACGVFEDELRAVTERTPNKVDVELLDAGLHAAPEKLRLRAQAAIDAASRGGYDAICFAYGLCGRGTAGLIARAIPLVLPRVHDCISLFLGSTRAYREQFTRHPGTFYFTTGWFKKKAHPENLRMAAASGFDPSLHPRYGEFREKYGDDNARYILEFFESWRRNYSRAALVDHGFATEEHEALTKAVAEASGWQYERLKGSLALLEDMVAGRWDEERFLVVGPGRMVVTTNDELLLGAVPLGLAAGTAEPSGGEQTGIFLYGDKTTGLGQDAKIGLGIDAGGTFTDAVLYDFRTGNLLSKAKSPTTHSNLVDGIAGALGQLDASFFNQVSYTCLSTTLATNAIVEGRGQPVGLILMPYHREGAAAVETPLVRCIGAQMNIQGVPQTPVYETEVLQAARQMLDQGAAALAVSGYGAVRNPEHELQVKEAVQRHFDMPVVCGHELSGRLNFVARAHTAVLNARLLPLIQELLDAVERVLEGAGIGGDLFVVRGDGAIMRKEAARTRVIETVLSGPAASAAGGRFLTGHADALVVDMGGTTTDVAALRDGRLTLCPDGARVGRWRTSVAAADIQTTGLGGDSAVRPDGRGIRIGPDRVVPLSSLAARWPGVRDELGRLVRAGRDQELFPEAMDFLVLVGPAEGLSLEGEEKRIAELLCERARSWAGLARACGCLAPQLLKVGRLERLGLVRRSSATPTDALHVLGEYCEYDREAAVLAFRALGRRLGMDETQAARLVRDEMERRLALALMRRELTSSGAVGGDGVFDRCRDLLDLAISDEAAGEHFRLQWRQARPVVGIGAPIRAFLPGACRRLHVEPVIPPDAEVANAVGAVASQVTVTEQLRIRPSELGTYILFAPDMRTEHAGLEIAEEAAREHIVKLIRAKARRFGTAERQVRVEQRRHAVRLRDGSTQLVEVEVAGFLTGAPALSRRADHDGPE